MPGGHYPKSFLQWLNQALARNGGSSLQKPVGLLEPPPVSAPLTDPLTAELLLFAQPVADASGLELVTIQIRTNRVPLSLQIQIRKADGGDVTLDECASFSAAISEVLDVSERLPEAYVLEISSPGIGEVLADDRDFHSFRGFPVEVRFQDSKGAAIAREGLLLGRDDHSVCLNLRGRTSRIPRADVQSVRLITPQA